MTNEEPTIHDLIQKADSRLDSLHRENDRLKKRLEYIRQNVVDYGIIKDAFAITDEEIDALELEEK